MVTVMYSSILYSMLNQSLHRVDIFYLKIGAAYYFKSQVYAKTHVPKLNAVDLKADNSSTTAYILF